MEQNTFAIKRELRNKVLKFDSSNEINRFLLNDRQYWLDKSTRLGLTNALQICEQHGDTTYDLWLGNNKYTVPIDYLFDFLDQLELYAIACNNTTKQHLANILKLNRNEISEYDITTGYPEPIIFDSSKIQNNVND